MKWKFLKDDLPSDKASKSTVVPSSDYLDKVTTLKINKKHNNKVLLNKNINNLSNKEAIVLSSSSKRGAIFNNISSGPVNSYLYTGERLTLIKKEGSFYKVKVNVSGAIGYISASNIKIIENGLNLQFEELISKGTTINITNIAYLREKPSSSSKILHKLKNNTSIDVLGIQGQWVKISYNNLIGYVLDTYINIENNKISMEKINSEMRKDAEKLTRTTIHKKNLSSTNHKNSNNLHASKENNLKLVADHTALNNLELANKTIDDLKNINVSLGEGYFALNELSKNYSVNSYKLENLIYTHIFDEVASCRGYVSYSEIEYVLNNGTEFQRKALIQKYGANCLVINLVINYDPTPKLLTPRLFYKENFYFKYYCANLYSLVNNPESGFKLCGVIDKFGNSPDSEEYDKAVLKKEVYKLGHEIPTWTQTQINC